LKVVLGKDSQAGSYENVALLIEMGYEVYTKPHGHHVVAYLRNQVNDQTAWTHVGANAELVSWHNLQLKKCPYLLDVALERFYTGQTLKHFALFHCGADPITEDLPGWFKKHNSSWIKAGCVRLHFLFDPWGSLHRSTYLLWMRSPLSTCFTTTRMAPLR
jgi:hypothetical protein